MIFDVTYMLDVLRQIIPYTPITLFLAIASMVLAGVFGLGIALIKQFQIPVLKQIVTVYVSFFRSIPTIVELFLIYYGLPQIFPVFSKMEALSATILGLSLKNAAYLSEIFRAGLLSVDDGQMEACIGVGISKTYAYQHIILPQAFQNDLQQAQEQVGVDQNQEGELEAGGEYHEVAALSAVEQGGVEREEQAGDEHLAETPDEVVPPAEGDMLV